MLFSEGPAPSIKLV